MTMTTKPHLSVAVIGHIDTGKSTILGHFQYKVGCIAQRTIEKLERESAELGKASFKFAWITDSLREERERGVSSSKVITQEHVLTLVNTPGHKNFMKNAITGIAQADAAVLVVAANDAEFAAGFGATEQTREFALLAFTLGIKQLIVAVNKMDAESVAYSQARFEAVERDVRTYLEQVGFDPSAVVAVPVSGWCGDNLVDRSAHNMPWYTGPTLLEAFDTFKVPRRAVDKPLRVTIQGSYKISGVGTVVAGRVETGVLTPGMIVAFAPSGVTGVVGSIERFHEAVPEALPGDSIGFTLRGVSHRDVRRGHVASDAKLDPAKKVRTFTAQLVILNAKSEIHREYSPIVHCHSVMGPCQIVDITEKLDRLTGDVIEKNPHSVKTGDACTVVLEPMRPMVVEAFRRYPALGRFAVRDMGTTIAVGVIKSVEKAEALTPKPVLQAAAARP